MDRRTGERTDFVTANAALSYDARPKKTKVKFQRNTMHAAQCNIQI